MEENVERLGPTLLEAFKEVLDPTTLPENVTPIPAIRTLATCAMLCNCHGILPQLSNKKGTVVLNAGLC